VNKIKVTVFPARRKEKGIKLPLDQNNPLKAEKKELCTAFQV
jgi:hypothetical protein